MALSAFTAALRTAGQAAVNAVLPPRCLGCGETVDATGALCATCFNSFTFIAAPMCRVCGLPLAHTVDDDLVCGGCIRSRPDFDRARAVFVYDDASKSLLLRFKHGDRTDAAIHMARWMCRAGDDLITTCDMIVPVPLHRWRLLWRSYNQSALLANAVSRLSGKRAVPDALIRTRATPSQGRMDRQARHRNVRDAFRVRPSCDVREKRVLLIDDVLTTGATAEACARALLAAGAKAVDVLVLGRVPSRD